MSQSILNAAENRHAVKAYDPSRNLTAEDVAAVKELLRLAPSSVNIQPWHFIFASSDEGKARIAKAAKGVFEYNKPSILNASHVVLFCAKTGADEAYGNQIVEKEDQDGRFVSAEMKAKRKETVTFYIGVHNERLNDTPIWLSNQVYINLGFFLMGVAGMGIDATPMEGVDKATLDEEFGLSARGLKPSFIVTLGYLDAKDDYNASLPKSRLPLEEILEEI